MAETEYPPEARFGWDLIVMTPAERDEMADYLDIDDFEGAESVVARAEERLFYCG